MDLLPDQSQINFRLDEWAFEHYENAGSLFLLK
jgi:hypothetical protein